jgi:hypothetical protein
MEEIIFDPSAPMVVTTDTFEARFFVTSTCMQDCVRAGRSIFDRMRDLMTACCPFLFQGSSAFQEVERGAGGDIEDGDFLARNPSITLDMFWDLADCKIVWFGS